MEAMSMTSPKTLVEAVRYYADLDHCQAVMVATRWPKGVTCPTCGSALVGYIATRRLGECRERHPRRQFSVKVGTIFQDSPRAVDEQVFRFNRRGHADGDGGRFLTVLHSVIGRRIDYKTLTGNMATA